MCALMEDDALCQRPNPRFGDDTLDWRIARNGTNDETDSEVSMMDKRMDCRASSYVQASSVFPPLTSQST